MTQQLSSYLPADLIAENEKRMRQIGDPFANKKRVVYTEPIQEVWPKWYHEEHASATKCVVTLRHIAAAFLAIKVWDHDEVHFHSLDSNPTSWSPTQCTIVTRLSTNGTSTTSSTRAS